jgi:hypothetical protein
VIYIQSQSCGGFAIPNSGTPSVLAPIPFVFSGFPTDSNMVFPSFFASLEIANVDGYINNIQFILESPPDVNGKTTKTVLYSDTPSQINIIGYRNSVKFVPNVYMPDSDYITFNSEIDPSGTYRCTNKRPDLIGTVSGSPSPPIYGCFESLQSAQCTGNGTWYLYVIDVTGNSNFFCSGILLTLQTDNAYMYMQTPRQIKIGSNMRLYEKSVIDFNISGNDTSIKELIIEFDFYETSATPTTYSPIFPNAGYIYLQAPTGELCSLDWRAPIGFTNYSVYHSTSIANKPTGFDPNSFPGVIGTDRWSIGLEDSSLFTSRYSTIFNSAGQYFPIGLDNLVNANPNGMWKIGFISGTSTTTVKEMRFFVNSNSSTNTTSSHP